jgi:hypothetical protein
MTGARPMEQPQNPNALRLITYQTSTPGNHQNRSGAEKQ